MRDEADHERSERDRTDGEQQDAAEVALELGPDGEVRAVLKKRRQEHDEHQFRIQRDGRQSRYECHRGAADQQCGGGRQAQAPRDELKGDHRDEGQQDKFEGRYGGHRVARRVRVIGVGTRFLP